MGERFPFDIGQAALAGEPLTVDRASRSPASRRAPEYSRMPRYLRVEFRAGELMSIMAMRDGQFSALVGDGSSTIFGDPGQYDSYLKLTASGVAARISEIAKINNLTGAKVLDGIARKARDFLRGNPGLFNGDSDAVDRRIADFEIKRRETKTVKRSPDMIPVIDGENDRLPRPVGRSQASEAGSDWSRHVSKAGIPHGPGRHSGMGKVVRHLKVHNGTGRSGSRQA